jgi:hypothetical protein
MKSIQEILNTHPIKPKLDPQKLLSAITEIGSCAQVCNTCADACLNEKNVQSLAGCIRLNLDCADICTATAAVLSRLTEAPMEHIRLQLKTCAKACEVCGAECDKHASSHAHCRVCAESCRGCAAACNELMSAMA